jgi:hypothetical protein
MPLKIESDSEKINIKLYDKSYLRNINLKRGGFYLAVLKMVILKKLKKFEKF